MSDRTRGILGAAVLVAAVWGFLHVGWYTHSEIVDYPVYEKYGHLIANQHKVPYRDFKVEYPPAALPIFAIPAWLDGLGYVRVFQGLMVLSLFGLVLAVLRLAGPRAAIATAVSPLLLGSVVISRYDLWPTALFALALAAVVSERFDLAGILTGTGFAAKLWPAIALPFVIVWLVRAYGSRIAARYLAISAAVAAAWFVPFVAMAPGGIRYPFHQELARPLQLESLGSASLILIHDVFGTSVHVVNDFGSQNLAGDYVGLVGILTTVVEAGLLVAIFLLFVRSESTVDDLLLSCGAAVATLFAFGKVFSPQFLIWIFPFAWIARGRRAAFTLPVYVAALVLTQSYFPYKYWDLTAGFTRPQVVDLFLRDLACVGIVVLFAWPRRLQHDLLGEHRSRIEALQRVRTQVE